MHYENYDKIAEIVDRIRKEERTLNALNQPEITVSIQDYRRNNWTIMAIGVWSDCEHDYKDEAIYLVKFIRSDVEKKIEFLKEQLVAL
jgi:hypothetical protein